MVKEFEYKGLTHTDWIGFQFEYEGNQYVVTEMVSPHEYIVKYVDKDKRIRMTAHRENLMDHYIKNLEAALDKIDRFDY